MSTIACSDGIIAARTLVAFIQTDERVVEITAPAQVRVDQSFNVLIFPSLDCGIDVLPAEVTVQGLTAEITPLVHMPQHRDGAAFTCEGRFPNFSVAQVRFTEPGHARLRIFGKERISGRGVVIERAVLVVP